MVTVATWTMGEQDSDTIRAALAEAADAKRDLIDTCPADHSHGCETCRRRAETAAEYDRLTGIITEAYGKAEADPEPWPGGETWAEAMGRVVRASPGYAELLAFQDNAAEAGF